MTSLMFMLLMFMLMMQFVVSTKAGLVNYVQGDVNVKTTQSVQAGVPIKVGPAGFAEILLNPGAGAPAGSSPPQGSIDGGRPSSGRARPEQSCDSPITFAYHCKSTH